MSKKSPEKFPEDVLYRLHHRNFPKSVHADWINKLNQNTASVHLHLEGDDVSSAHNVEFRRKKSHKKETLKMILLEFIFVPISLLFSNSFHAIINLLHYHHIFLFGFMIPHFISTLISWFATAAAKLGMKETLGSISAANLLTILRNSI